jgi:hypothetical protein
LKPNSPSSGRSEGAVHAIKWQLQRRYLQLEGLQTLTDNQPARLSAVVS